jgi:CRISPR-associated protein Cmr5
MAVKTGSDKPTLDQRRARHAWNTIQEILKKYPHQTVNGKRLPHEKARKISGQAKKLPTRIIASGLGQALAFLKAKDYAPDLLVEFGDWVLDKRGQAGSSKAKPKDDELLLAVVRGNSDFLRRATDEVLAYLLWLNRFAEAEKLTEGEGD